MMLVGSKVVLPRRIGCWRVDPALAAYLADCLQRRWAGLRLAQFEDVDALQREIVDAWVLGASPQRMPQAPALILGPLERDDALETVAKGILQTALPTTGRRVVARLERMLGE